PLDDLGVFAAPELSTDALYDGRVDVYSLGVIAFRVATGDFPGDGGVHDVPGMPTELAVLIARMLAIDPEARPSAAEARVRASCSATCAKKKNLPIRIAAISSARRGRDSRARGGRRLPTS